MTDASRKTLLVVFAHPDDESFGPGGTLARYAAAGVAVHLVCATRGEAGSSDLDSLGECDDLACRREYELHCAAEVLGLAGVHILGYRDSGMSGAPDNQHPRALIQADTEFVAGQIAAWICELRPQVVLTFDPHGGYNHPDHIAIHHATVRAFERVQAGLLPAEQRPQKLYYTAFSRTLLRWMVRLMPLFGRDPGAMGKNKDVDLRQIVANEMPITTRIDVSRYYAVREAASACHSSQLSGPGSILGWVPRPVMRHLQGAETFYRAAPAFGEHERVERDLFAGIEEE
ncbi:MAG: PIG-L family deacetylase [Anaerolineae bacterium]|nr:PIG-L family deacetylase [Anaerolineae bacterium]